MFIFDVFFNHCAEDTYLVQYLSQPLRNCGYRTFDRSVDEYPERPEDAISEDEALERSIVMVEVFTENSRDDASVQDLAARAIAAKKPIIVVNFTDQPLPEDLRPYPEIDGKRDHVERVVAQLENELGKAGLECRGK